MERQGELMGEKGKSLTSLTTLTREASHCGEGRASLELRLQPAVSVQRWHGLGDPPPQFPPSFAYVRSNRCTFSAVTIRRQFLLRHQLVGPLGTETDGLQKQCKN